MRIQGPGNESRWAVPGLRVGDDGSPKGAVQALDGDAPQPAVQPQHPAGEHEPPAHGVRRLLDEGHFDDRRNFEMLNAKFGEPETDTTSENADTAETAPVTDPPADTVGAPLEGEPSVETPPDEDAPASDETSPTQPQPEDALPVDTGVDEATEELVDLLGDGEETPAAA